MSFFEAQCTCAARHITGDYHFYLYQLFPVVVCQLIFYQSILVMMWRRHVFGDDVEATCFQWWCGGDMFSVCPSINNVWTCYLCILWRHFIKFAINIHQVSGKNWKDFEGQRSNVKVVGTPVMGTSECNVSLVTTEYLLKLASSENWGFQRYTSRSSAVQNIVSIVTYYSWKATSFQLHNAAATAQFLS